MKSESVVRIELNKEECEQIVDELLAILGKDTPMTNKFIDRMAVIRGED